MNEKTVAEKYSDIIDLPHHQSTKHKHMAMIDRAAQFSPFAALTGYDARVKETARVTEQRIELDDDEKIAISEKLYALQLKLAEIPRGQIPGVKITYFAPDERKDGGSYVSITGAVKKVDDIRHRIVMADATEIPAEDITALAGEVFEEIAGATD